MAFVKLNAFVLLTFLSAACSQQAQAVNDVKNGSFEANSTAPVFWDQSGQTPQILPTFTVYDRDRNTVTIEAVDGNSFVMLKTGGGTSTTWYSQLTQIIDVNVGESIAGVYFFATNDWMPQWNDTADIYLSSPEPNSVTGSYDIEILLAHKDVNSVVHYGGIPGGSMKDWGRFSYTFGVSGTYTLVLSVKDAIDYSYASYLAVDALRITAGPPPPLCAYKLTGDLNRDCKVDFIDFAKMAEHWRIDCNTEPVDTAACTPI